MTSSTVFDRNQKANELRYLQRQQEIEVAKRKVKYAFYTTMFLGGIATLISLLLLSQGNIFGLVDVAIVFGLGYGIYRYSEICTQLMLGYYVLSFIINFVSDPRRMAGIFIAGLIIRALWDGVVGAGEYNRLMREKATDDIATALRESKRDRSKVKDGDDVEKPISPTKINRLEPLNPSASLIELCGGDRAQAQWLLSQVKQKNPDESVAWCNEKAIEQLMGRQ